MSGMSRRTVAKITVIVLVVAVPLLLLTPVNSVGVRSGAGVASTAASDSSFLSAKVHTDGIVSQHALHRQILPNSYGVVQYLTSHLHTALFSYLLANNNSSEVALYNEKTNKTTDIQDVGGGPLTFTTGIVWAGDEYFLGIYNISAGGVMTYETYSTVYGLSVVATGLPVGQEWNIIGTTGGYVYVSSLGGLDAIDATTFAVVATYGSILPAQATIDAVRVVGSRLYVGGNVLAASGGSYALFGFIDTTTNTFDQLSATVSPPSYWNAAVYSIAVVGKKVVFGGQSYVVSVSPTFVFYTSGSVLFSYNPGKGTVTNLSGFLPASASADQLIQMDGYLGVVAGSFNASGPAVVGQPGFYLFNHALTGISNLTNIIGDNFLVLVDESSTSSGILFMGGTELPGDPSEIAAFNVASLV